MRKTFCLLAALLLAAGPAGASGDGAGKNRECAAGMNLMRNQWSGKRVAFLGDSITDERHVGTTKNYWQYLSEMLGIVPFVYGIKRRTTYWPVMARTTRRCISLSTWHCCKTVC